MLARLHVVAFACNVSTWKQEAVMKSIIIKAIAEILRAVAAAALAAAGLSATGCAFVPVL